MTSLAFHQNKLLIGELAQSLLVAFPLSGKILATFLFSFVLARGGCLRESNDGTPVEWFELLKLPLLIQLYLNVEGPSSYSNSHSHCYSS